MSRSDATYGLSARGRALVERARVVSSTSFAGLCDLIELSTYRLRDGRILEEYVQEEPWSSGPCWFLNLRVPGQEEGLPEVAWTHQEVANILRESYGDADPEPTASELEWWQHLIDDGSLVLDQEGGRVCVCWSQEQMARRALASGQLRPRPTEMAMGSPQG